MPNKTENASTVTNMQSGQNQQSSRWSSKTKSTKVAQAVGNNDNEENSGKQSILT